MLLVVYEPERRLESCYFGDDLDLMPPRGVAFFPRGILENVDSPVAIVVKPLCRSLLTAVVALPTSLTLMRMPPVDKLSCLFLFYNCTFM